MDTARGPIFEKGGLTVDERTKKLITLLNKAQEQDSWMYQHLFKKTPVTTTKTSRGGERVLVLKKGTTHD